MRGNGISRAMGIAVAALSLAVAGVCGQPANAQTAYCWTNSATGASVPSSDLAPIGSKVDPLDPNHATHQSNPKSSTYFPANVTTTYVRVPCPPTSTASSTIGGGYIGGELAKNWGRVRSTESLATTDVITNRFTDSGDPLGVGIVGGYNFKPWNNNLVIGPFASFDSLKQTINHNFAGGQFLGTTTHWFINAAVKAGVAPTPRVSLYGLAGAAFFTHKLHVNFVNAARSNTTTPGFTLGLGGEHPPSSSHPPLPPLPPLAQHHPPWWV